LLHIAPRVNLATHVKKEQGKIKSPVPFLLQTAFIIWLVEPESKKSELRVKFTQCGEKEYFTSHNLIFVLDCQDMGIIS